MTTISEQVRRRHSPPRVLSRAARVAFVLFGLVQLFVCAVVPLAEGRAPSKLGAHIEQPTERQHYVHDEAYCAACIASHLTGTAPAPPPTALRAARSVAQMPEAPLLRPAGKQGDPPAARAPPAPTGLG